MSVSKARPDMGHKEGVFIFSGDKVHQQTEGSFAPVVADKTAKPAAQNVKPAAPTNFDIKPSRPTKTSRTISD